MPVKYLPYRARRILNIHRHPDLDWFWDRYSAHPYIGCEHACEYCYARSDRYLQFDDPDDYDRVVKVKVNAPSLLRKELAGVPVDVLVAGDWQPAEAEFKLSRAMLEVIRERSFPLHIIEKSDLLLRDIELLVEISRRNWTCVSYSLSTADDATARLFEPCAPPPSRRLEAVRKLSEAGIYAGISYMPIIPFITDTDGHIEATVVAAAAAGAKYLLPASMTLADRQKERFFRLLEREYPELLPKYRELYAEGKGPPWSYENELVVRVAALCRKHGVISRIPKPVLKSRTRQARLVGESPDPDSCSICSYPQPAS